MKIYCLPEKVVTLEEKSLEKIDIAIQKSSPAGLLFLFSEDFLKSKKVTGLPVPERRKDDSSEHFL